MVKYWVKDINDANTVDQVKNLEVKYDKLDNLTKDACNQYKWENSYDNPYNNVMTVRSNKMKDVKIWSPEMESLWKEIQRDMFEISALLKNLKTSLEKMKQIRLFDKE